MSATIHHLPNALIGRVTRAPVAAATPREAMVEIALAQPFPVARSMAEFWSDEVTRELFIRGYFVAPLGDAVTRS